MTTKFKIGDKVRVKSYEWYISEPKNNYGDILKGKNFTEEMCEYCEEILTIKEVYDDYYKVDGNTIFWQDWMLEDKPVAEEKQEQQLKTNNMETKMTKKEAFDFLLGKKVLCLDQYETISVQKKLFEIGYMWSGEEQEPIIDYFAIFMREEELTMTSDINYWIEDECEKIEVSDILSIEIIEEEPIEKFDFSTLKPFDKVLVRDDKTDDWKCSLFSHLSNEDEDDNLFICVYGYWDYCIPYNEETMNLLGTSQEEPKKYRQ